MYKSCEYTDCPMCEECVGDNGERKTHCIKFINTDEPYTDECPYPTEKKIKLKVLEAAV